MRTKHFNWFILMFTEHTIIKILVGRLVRKKKNIYCEGTIPEVRIFFNSL